MSTSRRDLLRSLGVSALAGPTFRGISLEAALSTHSRAGAGKAASPLGGYLPKFFSPHQYETLQVLCQTIIPPSPEDGGAIEAGAPEFIDLLTSENKEFQLRYGGGIMWLDSTCTDRYGQTFLNCSSTEREDILNLIAFRKSAEGDPSLGPGIDFFSALRKIVADGFFTSEVGIKYLGYIGNTYLKEFPGCPLVPEA